MNVVFEQVDTYSVSFQLSVESGKSQCCYRGIAVWRIWRGDANLSLGWEIWRGFNVTLKGAKFVSSVLFLLKDMEDLKSVAIDCI